MIGLVIILALWYAIYSYMSAVWGDILLQQYNNRPLCKLLKLVYTQVHYIMQHICVCVCVQYIAVTGVCV